MFNSSTKKQAVKELEREVNKYESAIKDMQTQAIHLHNARTIASDVIKNIEDYVNTLANTPKEFAHEFQRIQVNLKSFKALSEITYDEKMMIKLAGGGTAAGVAAGVATAAFAPSAAMAIATTFGTASTGAAISGLSGAAATNAALAWLGGGAIAAGGGGGMAAGNALLALAGPIGWGIGAASLVAGGVFANSKNKKAAIKANQERIKIMKERRTNEAVNEEITALYLTTEELTTQLNQMMITFGNDAKGISSFLDFTQEQRDKIRAIINHTESLSALFMYEIGAN